MQYSLKFYRNKGFGRNLFVLLRRLWIDAVEKMFKLKIVTTFLVILVGHGGKCFSTLHLIFESVYQANVSVFARERRLKRNGTVAVGDMMLSLDQYQYLYSGDSYKRHGLSRAFDHWPGGIVPVEIDGSISADQKENILSAMAYISNKSCITWDHERKKAKNYVKVIKGPGCSSSVGNLKVGVQSVALSAKCKWGNIVHELLHTLGFLHMHISDERDKFVEIVYDNINPKFLKNFEKYSAYVSMFDTPYDYG